MILSFEKLGISVFRYEGVGTELVWPDVHQLLLQTECTLTSNSFLFFLNMISWVF